eukprot:TRINITY_DN1523_c0_g1_i1.p2 TRINITY_DN1523_c0_g1~~TRINITY_DN1523_c0_g1_i1.p2  ORF type:complete len:110 (-),score=22.96 TRINITY_DN1523_c0_g1_i1:148-477(-)
MDLPTYHTLAEDAIVEICEKLEDKFYQIGNEEYDVTEQEGILNITLGSKGVYVINKQPPRRQIWFSSPVSGPSRYDYIDGCWIDTRTNTDMNKLLAGELTKLLGCEVDL